MPLDQLHDQRLGLVGLFQAIDGRYVGVVQRGEDFGLALKPRQPLRVGGDVRRLNRAR